MTTTMKNHDTSSERNQTMLKEWRSPDNDTRMGSHGRRRSPYTLLTHQPCSTTKTYNNNYNNHRITTME
eukprot:9875472-Lingulodinium_polyedra.AAC.1